MTYSTKGKLPAQLIVKKETIVYLRPSDANLDSKWKSYNGFWRKIRAFDRKVASLALIGIDVRSNFFFYIIISFSAKTMNVFCIPTKIHLI
jgi:hypothetical protein